MAKPHLHCSTFGSGQQAIVAFHGFGQEGSVFLPLANAFPQYTVYAVDLFFHGQSRWHDLDRPLTRQCWRDLLEELLARYNINRFDLVGFSMGGRIALVTYELFAPRIDRLWLLAPDGIKPNAWYRIATRNKLLHGLFRYITSENPNIFHYSVRALEKHGLLHPMLAKIARQQMHTPQLRKRVYHTWMLYRHLEPDLAAVSRAVKQYKPEVQIATGAYDRVIRPQYMHKLTKLLGEYAIHEVYPCGHQGVLSAWLKAHAAAPIA